VKELLPGNWYFLWPVVMEHMVTPIKVQPKDIRVQSVWTKDGKDLAVGGAIVYYVKEPMKAILEVDDYDQSIQVIALAVICEWVSQHTVAELREDMEGLKKKLLADVREGSQGWGLKIQSVEITDIGVTRNIRLLTNGEPISGIL
jgi:regulator of protease activity HflC (stomatin/prohibitin superfamily)